MLSDQEILDALEVPEDRRAEVLAHLHAWSRSYLPGPNSYATYAAVIWAMLQRAPSLVLAADDPFDLSEWLGILS